MIETQGLKNIQERIEGLPEAIALKLIFGTGPAMELLREECEVISQQIEAERFGVESALIRKNLGEAF